MFFCYQTPAATIMTALTRNTLFWLLGVFFLPTVMTASIALSLTISRVQTKQPEGILTVMSGFNGKYMGPDIVVGPGDRIIATVTNQLVNYTTVHWHGMLQKNGDNNMDGVPFVSQVPIPPGGTYVYNFTTDGSGTFWYHSHSLNQYVDGVLGALIVRSPAELEIYNDRFLLLKDYYRNEVNTYFATYLSPESGGAEPIPDNVLINGIGQTTTCLAAQNCSYVTVQSSTFTQFCGMYSTYSAVLKAQALAATPTSSIPSDNKITRLKFIAGNAIAVLNVSVDGHNMWVLALDGMSIVPVRLTSILINAGQRVDVALCRQNPALSTPAWIRINVDVDSVDDPTAMVNLGPLAILYYSNDREVYGKGPNNDVVHYSHATTTDVLHTKPNKSMSILPSGIPYNLGTQHGNDTIDEFNYFSGTTDVFVADTTVFPGMYPPPPATKTYIIPLIMFANNNTKMITMASFDGVSYVQPQTNLLASVKAGLSLPKASPPHPLAYGPMGQGVFGFNYLQFSSDDVVQLVINNYDGGEHPIHVHGRRFYDMGRGRTYAGPFNASKDLLNTVNPILRDTVTVSPMSWVVLRFADHNPGVWPLHCHIDWHMAAGLFMILYETPSEPTSSPTPTEPAASSTPIVVGTVLGGVGAMFLWFLYDYYYRNCCHAHKNKAIRQKEQEQQNEVEVDVDNNPRRDPSNRVISVEPATNVV